MSTFHCPIPQNDLFYLTFVVEYLESAVHSLLLRLSKPEWINSTTHADSILFLQEEGIPPT